MVVGIHADFLADISPLGEYLTVSGLFRIAVPIFILINGFYFFRVVNEGTQINWLKRISILYVAWMIFFIYFWFFIPEMSLESFLKLFQIVFFGHHHLWYLPGIIGAAIVLLTTRKMPQVAMIVLVFIVFVIGVYIQYAGNYHLYAGSNRDILFNEHWFHRNFLFFAYPFFALGYLINKTSLHKRISLKVSLTLSLFGLAMLLCESYINYYQEGRDGGFDNFASLIIAAPAIFILFIQIKITAKSKKIALYASAIYFIHLFVLSFFHRFTHFQETSLTLIVIIISVCASYFIIQLNNRLKFIL